MEMKSCVVTQAFGDEWHKVLELTRPRMEAYCSRTGQDFIAIEKPLVEPVQYSKLVLGNLMATRGYERATFIDADILIAHDCDDIAKSVDEEYDFLAFNEGEYLDRKAGLGGLATAFGTYIDPQFYFNTGVFVMHKGAIGAMSQPPLGLFPNHFAEQTWLNLQLHLWKTKTANLDPAYNCMTSVESHFGLNRHNDALLIHYAGQSGDMTKLREDIVRDDVRMKELGR